MINEAYAETNTASDVDDYSKIIELLEQAKQAKPSPKQSSYINSLSGWAHNRRGELYVNQFASHNLTVSIEPV